MEEKMSDYKLQVPLKDKPLRHLNRVAKRPKMDLEFQDLSYSVRDINEKRGWRQILNSINGKFRCGELTAIMGPSGAGKSSLLNILAGSVTVGVEGIIKVNDRPRDLRVFNKLSSYIMQEDCIQMHITVKEAMIYAACLKLGAHIEYKDKLAMVDEVINLLGLETCVDTMSEHLSGGQRKRLSVALELVNNPPVIFLDEPMTGLDNFATKQCIDLLKKISLMDRTVICTIHQPPDSIIPYFDQVYIVANGCCVYNGSPGELVPFFSLVGQTCPSNNSPCDFIIELVHSQPTVVQNLRAAIQDGKINMRETTGNKLDKMYLDKEIYDSTTEDATQDDHIEFANSFVVQFSILFCRMLVQMRRNRLALCIQFFHHLLSACLFGWCFYKVGNDGSQTLANYKMSFVCIVYLMYTYAMIPIIQLPLELKSVKNEHFNRWYGLKAYFSARTAVMTPLPIVLCLIFSAIVYVLSDQPMEISRFLGFYLVTATIAVTSQGLGSCVGSLFSITAGAVVGPVVMAVFTVFAMYGMGYRDTIEPFYKVAMMLSFLRFGIVAICNALFHARPPLVCPDEEIYCHYSRPEVLLADMAIPVIDYKYPLAIMCIFMLLFRFLAYYFLKSRLNSEVTSRMEFFVQKCSKVLLRLWDRANASR